MKRGILYLIIFAGFLASCKKYEDGPFISLRSLENRIIGRYKLYTYTVNGVDSINLFNDSLYNEFNFFDGKIYGYDAVNGCTIDGLRNDSNIFHLSWVWKLDNDNKILKVKKQVFMLEILTGILEPDHLLIMLNANGRYFV